MTAITIPKRYCHEAFAAHSLAELEGEIHWAVYNYGHHDYEYMNSALRRGRKLDQSELYTHKKMRKALVEINEPITLWRGIYIGPEQKFNLKDEWSDRGWVSTSLSRKIGAMFAGVRKTPCHNANVQRYLIKLNVQPGIKILPLSAILHVGAKKHDEMWPEHMDEREIVLPPRLKYRVIKRRDVKRTGFTTYIHVDVDVSHI